MGTETSMSANKGRLEGELFTQGQMDEFAMENLEQERYRIHGILTRVLPEHKEIFDKCILGNRK